MLFEHFRFHLITSALIVGLLAAILRFWVAFSLAAFCFAVNLVALLTATPYAKNNFTESSTEDYLTVVHANLGTEPNLKAFIDWAKSIRADVLSLQEINANDLNYISKNLAKYDLIVDEPRPDTRGVAMWARSTLPISEAEIIWPDHRLNNDRPVAYVMIDHPDEPMMIVGAHFARPRNAARAETQDDEIIALAKRTFPGTGAVLWLGDFNATPWSSATFQAHDIGALQRVKSKNLWPATWPDGAFLHFGLPVDFAMISGDSEAIYSVGPSIQSDHRPIAVKVRPRPTW